MHRFYKDKSQEGQIFKSRHAFWTLRPNVMGGGVIRPTGCGCGFGVCVCGEGDVMMLVDSITPF